MNHVRPIAEVFSFAPMNYEYIVYLPQADKDQLLDVKLSMHGHPGLGVSGVALGAGCEDVHVYLNDVDITPSLLNVIRQSLDSLDQGILKQQYKAALDKWLDLEAKLGAGYPNSDLAAEKAKAAQLLATNPLSSLLSKFGDFTAGWSGNLHISHFLYTFIELPPVSLLKVIQTHNSVTGAKQIDPKKITSTTFSCGPCRLYSSNWDPKNPVPKGGLFVLIEPHYHDPLEDKIAELEKKIDFIKKEMTKVLNRVGNGQNSLGEQLLELGNLVNVLKNTVMSVSTEVSNHDKRILSLATTVGELRDAINKL